GASFAVAGDTVYGLTPGRDAVYRYDGSGSSWTKIGGPAGQIYAGDWGYGLVATSPSAGDLKAYLGTPDSWRFIGTVGASFAVATDTVYKLTPTSNAVYRYVGSGLTWTKVGDAAHSIIAGDI
ncbi:hypothetical protein, partial [Streptomyces sp. SAS_272]|uniref:hypothetical protein n=1 Tax=Streptomyces sp. SAS_272 TaxID=3412747 RepID=UPI00403CF3B6